MRAVYDAVAVPAATSPYDVVHLRVDFPAAPPDAAHDPATGLVGPDPQRLPLPVVVLHQNFNCGPELYGWLARALARAGFAVVRFTWVDRLFGGRPGLSTGIDLSAAAPETIGTRSPHALLDVLLRAAARAPELAGALDLSRVVLGGHSAGGSLAVLSASPQWHPGVVGAFSYGGHTRAQVPQGFGADAYLPIPAPGSVPLLLMGGTADGVVDAVGERQGQPRAGHPMQVTFEQAVPAGTPAWLVLVDGADHYAFAQGYDGSTGRGYLEAAGPAHTDAVRDLLARLVTTFCAACTGDQAAGRALDEVVARPPAGVTTALRR